MAEHPKILVVDDNEAMRYSAVRHLRGAGFEVVEAATGREALQAMEAAPDLVLLDLKLPDISGFEVCRRLKSDARTRTIPVVQISASFLEQEVKDLSGACGADAFIAQPVSKQELLATVSGLLRTSRPETSATSAQQAADEDLREVLVALGEKNRTLSAILDASPIAILALDNEDRITLWNAGATRMFGWTQEEVIGRPIPFVPDDKQEELASIRHTTVALRGQVSALHTLRVAKDGRLLDVVLSSAALLDPDNKVRGRVVVAEDVTLRKQAQNLLVRNEKLIATGRMAATLAHEINNPLASLTNLMYLLRMDQDLSETARKFVNLASEEVARVTHITRQMLSFHREADTALPISMSEVLDSVLDLHTPAARAVGIEIKREYRGQVPVLGFPGEMRQALSNLVANALYAMPPNGRLAVRVRRGHYWRNGVAGTRILVADTGSGIPCELRRKIFEPFFTSKGERGTGLGLFVVQQVVQRSHGHVAVRSSTAKGRSGTCFSLFFPGIPSDSLTNSAAAAHENALH